jgi:hypothetical protein
MEDLIVLMMVLLVAGFVSTRLASFVKMPHSVFLVVIGLVAGVLIKETDPTAITSLSRPTILIGQTSSAILCLLVF